MRIYPKSLKQEAAERLGRLNCNPRKVLLVYAAVAFGVSLVAALMNVFLNSRVAQTGGLDGLEPGTVVAEASNLFPRIDVKKGVPVTISFKARALPVGN